MRDMHVVSEAGKKCALWNIYVYLSWGRKAKMTCELNILSSFSCVVEISVSIQYLATSSSELLTGTYVCRATFLMWSAIIQTLPSIYMYVHRNYCAAVAPYISWQDVQCSWNTSLSLVPGGAADRAGGVELGEEQSLICHPLNVWGRGGRVAIGREITPTKLRNRKIKFIMQNVVRKKKFVDSVITVLYSHSSCMVCRVDSLLTMLSCLWEASMYTSCTHSYCLGPIN